MIDRLLKTYYIRIADEHVAIFIRHLLDLNLDWSQLSSLGPHGSMFHVRMDAETALLLKISHPMIGCLDFNKAVGGYATADASMTIALREGTI
jgi:hypothetical protein